MIRRFAVLAAGLAMLGAVAPGAVRAGDLDTLVAWMTGSFTSADQAEADTSYLDIRLEMVRIWSDRTEGPWLYVEQAAASRLSRPYRQRVYRVSESEPGVFRSEVFEFRDPLRFAGSWKDPLLWRVMTPDSLVAREGCAVILRRDPSGCFAGATEERACASTLRGASYAASEARVYADRIETWDRGFDAEGKQVWGAEKGPYVFRRKPAGANPRR